jgi:TPR repeat protein/pimeloyl-ACP methyl ester carboxylesterase
MQMQTTRKLLASLFFVFVALPAWATSENIARFNQDFEDAARAAIRLQIGSGGSLCAPAETASRAIRRNQVSWQLAYRCKRKEGRKSSGLKVAVKIESYTFDHETIAIRNWKDFMVEEREFDHPIDHKQTEWVDEQAYIARIKQRWLRWNKDNRSNIHTAWVAAEAKKAFSGLRPDGDFRPDSTPMAIRIVVEVEYAHSDTDTISPAAGQAALAIADAILKDLGGEEEKPEIEFLDANPIYSRDGVTLPRDWRPSELATADEIRDGVATDGQSLLIVRARLSTPEQVVFDLSGERPGKIDPLLDAETIELGGKHFAFALYTPPERFDDATAANAPVSMMRPPARRIGEVLEVRGVEMQLLTADGGKPLATRELQLARPPVVLVHGLFADPLTTWVDTFDTNPSMVRVLELAGFLPFLVNYENSNGMWKLGQTGTEKGSWIGEAIADSSFEANRRVVWESPMTTINRVDYQNGWFTEEPIKGAQQVPETIRIGGISEAVRHYRDELNLAATQATVIGHSMGGLLARVWASENYNPDYRAARNFMAGDIYRLMTLNTPHHGSEVPELRDALADATIDDEQWLNWARREIVNSALNWYLDPEPGAISDLRPGSLALKRIGATPIPSVAIATVADPGQYGDPNFDPLSLYNSLYALAGTVFFQNRPLLDRFVRNRYNRWRNTADPFRHHSDWNGQPPVIGAEETDIQDYASIIGNTIDETAYHWARLRDAEYEQELRQTLKGVVEIPFGLMRSQMGNPDDLELLSPKKLASEAAIGLNIFRFYDESKIADIPRPFMALLHDLIFHHDARSDGVVKLTSQIGGAVEHEPVKSVLHSYSPWNYAVQSRVIRALKWQPELFDPEGFPAAGGLTPRFLPGRQFTAARITGERAINWSGMVPAHARQYLAVADSEDAIVLVRPVNPDSTRLLAKHAAAKGMNVKGKSANWGPQSGYIPENQRYSKLWRMFREPVQRDNLIDKYNAQVVKSLTTEHPEFQGLTYAVERELEVTSASHGNCDVLQDPSEADAESAVILKCGSTYHDWRNSQKNEAPWFDPAGPLSEIDVSPEVETRLEPLKVLADPTQEHKPYLTADYDLLAIGFRDFDGHHGVPETVSSAEFHKVRGVITERQWDLVDRINRAVQDNACYDSGQVTHHGPENQYPDSPYIDYPILVLDPMSKEDKSDGVTYLVRQGPPGFRDIHLKRLFEEKIRQGFNLWPNPVSKGWSWEKRRKFNEAGGYDPRDAGALLVYVGEAPEPSSIVALNAESDCAPSQANSRPDAKDGEDVVQDNSTDGKESVGSENEIQQVDNREVKAFEKQTGEAASEPEASIWNDVKNSKSAEELGYYLELYPDGIFAPLARIRIRRLETESNAAAETDPVDAEKQSSSFAPKSGVYECDRLAASPVDLDRVAPAVHYSQMIPNEAIDACREVVAKNPEEPRLAYQLARTLNVYSADNEVFHYFRVAAINGHAAALWEVASLYYFSCMNTDSMNPILVASLYEKAADAGNPAALNSLGSSYTFGRGVSKDPKQAVELFRKAATKDSRYGAASLARAYERGEGVPADQRKARYWHAKYVNTLQNDADRGDHSASELLSEMYKNGDHVPKDPAAAEYWSGKMVTQLEAGARNGHAWLAQRLGSSYLWGLGVEKAPDKAVTWLRKAAEAGDAYAMIGLADIVKDAVETEKWYGKALQLYAKNAESGDPRAMRQLGDMYLEGQGTQKNEELSLTWHQRANDTCRAWTEDLQSAF